MQLSARPDPTADILARFSSTTICSYFNSSLFDLNSDCTLGTIVPITEKLITPRPWKELGDRIIISTCTPFSTSSLKSLHVVSPLSTPITLIMATSLSHTIPLTYFSGASS